TRLGTIALLVATLGGHAVAQDTSITELERRIAILAEELEDLQLTDIMPAAEGSEFGLGPAASKVYRKEQGLSIGGYGEGRYRNYGGAAKDDVFDFYRAVLYFGYRFDEDWVFNSEIEMEHVNELSVEFAYLDWLGGSEALNARLGLMLLPLGLVNEYHEPTTFLAANRSIIESQLIPTTARENGVGIFGALGSWDYKLYLVNGMDGTGFTDGSLRGGRQKGAKALANDFALVGSLETTASPGLRYGASAYFGDSGQDQGQGEMATSIVETHCDYRAGSLWARGLLAFAKVDERTAGDINLSGSYAEVGYDLLDGGEQALFPFLRYENMDENDGNNTTALTYGLHYRPLDSLVLKLDHTDFGDGDGTDVTTFLMGYVF
ncbi:MAG: hypothetical protein QF411_04260, partial [Planctomycetota bacterium]|nr:hypothetical protein [Planctomycetota bacterium]